MASSALAGRAVAGTAFATCSTAYQSTSLQVKPQAALAAPPLRRGLKYGSSGSSLLAVKTSSAFLNGGVSSQALVVKGRGVQREGGSRGGALSVEANLFGRIVRIVKSYANAVVSSAEDPEKLLDQTVIEMGDDLAKMRQASAQVLASQKQLEQRYKQAQSNADDWLRRAKLALSKGQEELAKEALKKKKDYEDNANALRAQLDAQKGVVDKLIGNTRLLESKISEAKSKKDTLKARAQSAKTSQKVQEMLGNINTSSAMAAFEKMEEKVNALEAESDAVAQLGTDDLSAKFALLESSDVDSDLEALKREMSGLGSSQTRAALPGGQSTGGQSKPGKTSVKDLEIEAELNELRKKASDL